MPICNFPDVSGYVIVATGNYAGNNGDNRAIPHGLGVAPKCVIIWENTKPLMTCHPNFGKVFNVNQAGNQYSGAVNAADATNFYVGNAAPDYPSSANATGSQYFWVALA